MTRSSTSRTRLLSLPAGGFTIELPAFFPSISSLKADLPLRTYLRVLLNLDYPQLLVSAFDIRYATPSVRQGIHSDLRSAAKRGIVTLLDSGGYESYWSPGRRWTPSSLAEVIRSTPIPLAFCYDQYPMRTTVSELAKVIDRSVARDQRSSNRATVLPVIHGKPGSLPPLALAVARRIHPLMIAVPERDLGEGLVQRTHTIRSIRSRLDRLPYYVPIHLLGTGSPISILVFVLAGADSFDGLSWCNTVINHQTGQQYGFHQADLLDPNALAIPIQSEAYSEAVLLNNLVFYITWLRSIRSSVISGNLRTFASTHLPAPILSKLSKVLEA